MKKKIVLLTLLLSVVFVFGQVDKSIDSLVNKLKTSNDSIKIVIFDELAWRLKYNNPTKAKNFAENGIKISIGNFEVKKIMFYNTLGIIYRQENSIEKAIECYKISIKLSKKFNKNFSLSAAYINLGVVYKNLKKHKTALDYYNLAEKSVDFNSKRGQRIKNAIIINRATVYSEMNNDSLALKEFLRAEKISKKNKFNRNLETLYHNISIIYEGIENYRKALSYQKKSLFLAKNLGNKLNISQSYNSIGVSYSRLKKIDSALIFLTKGLLIAKSIKDKNEIGNSHYSLGEFYININKFEKSLYHSKLSLKNIGIGKYKSIIVYNHINIAKAYINLKKFQLAKKHLGISFKISTDEKLEVIQKIYNYYTILNYSIGNISEALKNHKKSDSIIKIINSNKRVKILNDINIKYKTQQKENKILTLENETQQKEISLQKSKFKTNATLAGLFLFVIGGGFYFRKRKKDQQLKVLEESIKSTEQEKIRIGKELHDGIAGNILKLVHNTEQKDVQLSHQLLDAYKEIRTLSHQLNNTSMHGELFSDRVFELLPQNKENQTFAINITPPYLELTEPYSTHFYRIIQELITNNLKYAKASKTSIEISLQNDVLKVNYKDNGVGTGSLEKGNGLKSIEDRVTLLNGKITLKTAKDKGFEASVEVPYVVTK